ncbi:MAG: hypothetical protein R3E50_13755 [Halioglobus sp.]
MVYRVGNADPRLDRVELHVQSTYAKGTVEAFFRPPPVQQAAFEHITNLVASTEFQQQNALVIAPPRGLGEDHQSSGGRGARIMMSLRPAGTIIGSLVK